MSRGPDPEGLTAITAVVLLLFGAVYAAFLHEPMPIVVAGAVFAWSIKR